MRLGSYYYGWNVVAACVLSQTAINSLALNSISLFLHEWSQEFHAPISELALSVGLLTFVAAVFSPIVGVWADRFSARRLFGLGLLGVGMFFLAVSYARAPWQILVLYTVILPLPLCLATTVPSNSLISRWFVRRLGLAIGLSSFGIGMAGVVVPPIVSHLLQIDVGWRVIWRVGGAVCTLIVLPLVVLAIRNRPDPERDGLHYLTDAAGKGARLGRGHAAGISGTLRIRDIVRRRNFWLIIFIVMPLLGIHIAVSQNMAPYAIAHGLTRQAAGELIAVLSFSNLVANLVVGLLSDRYGNRVGLAALVVMAATGCLMLAFTSALPLITLGAVLGGALGAVMTLLGAGIAEEFGADGFGRAFGSAMFFLPLPVFSGAALAKSYELTGSYATGFLGLATLLPIPIVLLTMLRERRSLPVVDAAPAAGSV